MIEPHAERYADEFASSEALAAAARRRLAWRIRRASHGSCVVCGAPLTGRADEVTCSGRCRKKKARMGHV